MVHWFCSLEKLTHPKFNFTSGPIANTFRGVERTNLSAIEGDKISPNKKGSLIMLMVVTSYSSKPLKSFDLITKGSTVMHLMDHNTCSQGCTMDIYMLCNIL